MTHYASIVSRFASLSTDFGEQMARKYFGDEVVDKLPRYVRGAKKGKFKGELSWKKVDKGGWVRTRGYMGESDGYVERRTNKVIEVVLSMPIFGEEPEQIARWQRER